MATAAPATKSEDKCCTCSCHSIEPNPIRALDSGGMEDFRGDSSARSDFTNMEHQNIEGKETDTSPPKYSLHAKEDEAALLFEKERLRRFLSVLLSIDYQLFHACPDRLRRDDWCHFMRLSRIAHEVFYSVRPKLPSQVLIIHEDWSDERHFHLEIDKYIKCPARALGIDTRVVVGMLATFAARHRGFYFAQNWTKEWYLGPRLAVEKLQRDENSLMDTLIPAQANVFRSMMAEEIYNSKGGFTRLESPTDYKLTALYEDLYNDQEKLRWNRSRERDKMESVYTNIAYLEDLISGRAVEPEPGFWNILWQKISPAPDFAHWQKTLFGCQGASVSMKS